MKRITAHPTGPVIPAEAGIQEVGEVLRTVPSQVQNPSTVDPSAEGRAQMLSHTYGAKPPRSDSRIRWGGGRRRRRSPWQVTNGVGQFLYPGEARGGQGGHKHGEEQQARLGDYSPLSSRIREPARGRASGCPAATAPRRRRPDRRPPSPGDSPPGLCPRTWGPTSPSRRDGTGP